MKAKGLILGMLTVLFFSCNAQMNRVNNDSQLNHSGNNKPQTNIKVNKVYDKDGNLVKYDSVYTYFYSNMNNDSVAQDSMFGNFSNEFYNQLPNINRNFFDNQFFNDTSFLKDFYNNDFFSNRFHNNMDMMDKMFQHMDSIKNSFYNQQYQQQKSDKGTKTL